MSRYDIKILKMPPMPKEKTMTTHESLQAEYHDLLEKIKDAETEAAEESDNGSDEMAAVHKRNAERLQNLLHVVEVKLRNTSTNGMSLHQLDQIRITQHVSREIRDCKMEILANQLADSEGTTKTRGIQHAHVEQLEKLLAQLTS